MNTPEEQERRKVYLQIECDSCGGWVQAFSSEEERKLKGTKASCTTDVTVEIDGEPVRSASYW